MKNSQTINSLYREYAATQLQYAKQLTANIYLAQAALPLFGIGFVLAFILNNLRYSHVYGTWLQSHFRWQIQTFVFGMILGMLAIIIVFQSRQLTINLPFEFEWVGYAILALDIVWIYYRIIKGRLKLTAEKPMYKETAVKNVFE